MIIGLTGFAQTGKNTAAEALIARGWRQMAFADKLREILRTLDPIVGDQIDHGEHEIKLVRLSGISDWKAPLHRDEIRRLIQVLGTEIFREEVGWDFWVNAIEKRIDAGRGPVVITDVRFGNEAAMIKRRGGAIIRITRPGVEACNAHCSEHQEIESDWIIANDGTIGQLHARLLEAVEDLIGATT